MSISRYVDWYIGRGLHKIHMVQLIKSKVISAYLTHFKKSVKGWYIRYILYNWWQLVPDTRDCTRFRPLPLKLYGVTRGLNKLAYKVRTISRKTFRKYCEKLFYTSIFQCMRVYQGDSLSICWFNKCWSTNGLLSAVYWVVSSTLKWREDTVTISFLKMLNSKGLRRLPCGMPHHNGDQLEHLWLHIILSLRFCWYDLKSWRAGSWMPHAFTFASCRFWLSWYDYYPTGPSCSKGH